MILPESIHIIIYNQDMQYDEFPYADAFDWCTRSPLGEGSYGKVFKVRNLKDGQFYAIKQMKMEVFNSDPTLMESLIGQIKITMDVNSDYTVKMLTYKIGKVYTYIVLEICDSDLRKRIAQKKFTEQQCIGAFSDIMKGFEILVGKGYIHRDIKPANILEKGNHYKVADFGFATKADIFGRKKMTDICGTPLYMAPQLLNNEPYNAKSDIWSLGLMLYEMVFGYVPWPCRSLEEYNLAIRNRPLTFPYDAKIGQNTKDFIQRSLVVNEQQRISWQQVFNHKLIAHQELGSNVKAVQINEYVKKILLKLQRNFAKYNIRWSALFDKYLQTGFIDPETFEKMLREVDPSLTTHEAGALFNYIDNKKCGVLDIFNVEQILVKIDYRSHDDILSRKVDEIAAILKDKKINAKDVFELSDVNHSGALDFKQFANFLKRIAPFYKEEEIIQIFRLFDDDKNGMISKAEFMHHLDNRCPSVNHYSNTHVKKERAICNLRQLNSFLKWKSICKNTFFQMADKDNNKEIDIAEFYDFLTNKIMFRISKEEIEDLFLELTGQKNGVITLIDVMNRLQ